MEQRDANDDTEALMNAGSAAESSSPATSEEFHSAQESEELISSPSQLQRRVLSTQQTMSSIGSSFAPELGTNNQPSTTALLARHSNTKSEQILFFACGLGSSICYIATLSCLVYFKLLYGAESFVFLNLAVYVPLLPISLAQARWDSYYDMHYQSKRTYLARGLIGFGLGLWGTIRMTAQAHAPAGQTFQWDAASNLGSASAGPIGLIFSALLQGTGGAILYGTLNQLASFVGNDPRQLKATVSAGVQASALVVLAVSIYTGFGVHETSRFAAFLWNIVAIEAFCMIMFIWLITARPVVAISLMRRDSSLRIDDYWDNNDRNSDEEILLGEPLISPSSEGSLSAAMPMTELSFDELWTMTRSCGWSLVVTLVPSFLVGSWFTQVVTNWMALAEWLFYIRIASDFVGRLATLVIPPRTIACLRWTSFLRLIPVLVFFIHSGNPLVQLGWKSDALSMFLVAIIAFFSGYLVTGCFQLAPLGIPIEMREANLAKQASLLTVAFSVSALGGLLSSFALMGLGV